MSICLIWWPFLHWPWFTYLKKYKDPGFRYGSLAIMSGLGILGIINAGIIPGLPDMAAKFEIFFVNTFGLPYKSGIIIFIMLFLGILTWAVRFSHQRQKVLLNTSLLSFAFVLMGYSTYIMVLARSEYNPPINENNPSDVLRFVSYLKREQYENRPLLYGPSFVSQPITIKRGSPFYRKKREICHF